MSVSFCELKNRIRMQNFCDVFLCSSVLILKFMFMLEATAIRQINICVI